MIEQVKGVFSAVRDMVGAEDIQGALGMIDGLLGGTFEATPLPESVEPPPGLERPESGAGVREAVAQADQPRKFELAKAAKFIGDGLRGANPFAGAGSAADVDKIAGNKLASLYYGFGLDPSALDFEELADVTLALTEGMPETMAKPIEQMLLTLEEERVKALTETPWRSAPSPEAIEAFGGPSQMSGIGSPFSPEYPPQAPYGGSYRPGSLGGPVDPFDWAKKKP
jgi:hypothetical protein